MTVSLEAPARTRARRVVLATVALAFGGIAVASLFAPDVMAQGLGYRLDNVDARSEFRAVYVGVWLATCAVFAGAARRPDDRARFAVCVLLLGGQVLGRTLSLVLDGAPTMKVLPWFGIEVLGVVVLLALRPRST